MLTQEKASDIFDRIRRFSSADEVEAIFTGSCFALTRFANNTIHQNVEEENSIVSIRTNFGGRTARAAANQFDDESLRRAVTASENLARVQAPDPDLLPMPTAEEAKAAGEGARATRFFAETASITPADRAEVVRGIVSVAAKHRLTTAGIYSTSESQEGIFNSSCFASTGRGILVTRLWYIREVDPYEKIVTGMTRDGTFLIEGGKIRFGLRNFRFNQSLISMLKNVEAMSAPVRASGEESFDMVVPAMTVKEFNFTEVTKF